MSARIDSYLTSGAATPTTPRPVRHVVLHRPGPKWKPGVDFREQEGVVEHVQHYLKLHIQGRLELGGPFLLQDTGGKKVTTKEVSREELEDFAARDPAGAIRPAGV